MFNIDSEKMTKNDRVIDISAEVASWSKPSIYRIPLSVTCLKNKKVYEPQMVSIGPYHHRSPNLKAMEKHKLRAQSNFLKRLGKPLSNLRQELSPLVQDLKDTYDELDDNEAKDPWQDTEFLNVMVMDGCFILELLRTTTKKQTEGASSSDHGYPQNDRIFSKHGRINIVPYLKRDMLMLENQIPMVVLEKLDSLNHPPSEEGLPSRILNFFSEPIPLQIGDCSHILDLYRKSLIIEPKQKHISRDSGRADQIIRSATELNEAGIIIKKSETDSLKDISFTTVLGGFYGAVLRLPLVVVDDAFESAYLNLIAYERLHPEAGGNDVTSYVFFMDNIIDSIQDVRLLHAGRVIQNALGSEEAVAMLFNSLSADSTLDPDSDLGKVHYQVSKYCKKRWNRWRAYCCHHYFANPWVSITVVAAIFIFAITVLQTVYSALSYHNKSSS